MTKDMPVAEEIREGIWAWDIPNERIYWSPQVYDMLGMPYRESPLTLETILAWVHSKDRENLKSIFQTSLNTGDSFETEFKIRHSSGAYRCMQFMSRVYLYDHHIPTRLSGLVVDITEQKKAEESVWRAQFTKEFKHQTERITALEDITLSQRQEIDARKIAETELKQSLKREKLINHLIRLMSRSFDVDTILNIATRKIGSFFEVDRCRIISYEKEDGKIKGLRLATQYYRSEGILSTREEDVPLELIEFLKASPEKKHPLVFLNASAPEKFPSDIKHHLESHGIKSAFIIEIKYRGVSFGWLALHQCLRSRVWTEQEINFLEVLVAHIGSALYQAELYQQEREAKQEAEETNRQKTKILSFVSHDFKNPLDAIMRFINILKENQDDVLSEKHRKLVDYIAEGIIQLRYMVTDILDKARLDEGRVTPVPERIELRPFIDELRPIFNAMASQRNVQVCIEIQPELIELNADPTHLRQILINLISNAVKYNRVNGKTFLKFYLLEDEQSVMIEVQDTGIGIPPEKISQLFTEYYRADLSAANPVEGTGLGLSFIKKLIELHGGRISIESEVDIGSVFKVVLPFTPN